MVPEEHFLLGRNEIVVIPAPGEPPVRVRPPAHTLMDRLRMMQSQAWN